MQSTFDSLAIKKVKKAVKKDNITFKQRMKLRQTIKQNREKNKADISFEEFNKIFNTKKNIESTKQLLKQEKTEKEAQEDNSYFDYDLWKEENKKWNKQQERHLVNILGYENTEEKIVNDSIYVKGDDGNWELIGTNY